MGAPRNWEPRKLAFLLKDASLDCTLHLFTQDAQISKLLRGLWKSPQGSIVDIRDDMGTSSHLISCQVGVQKRCFFFNLNWTQPRIHYHRVATGLLRGSSIFGTMSEPPGETRTTAVCCPALPCHPFPRRKESHPCTRAFGLLCWASCHMSLGYTWLTQCLGLDGLHRWPAEWRITFSRFRAKLLSHMRHFFCTESISSDLRWGWYCNGLWHRGGCREAGKLPLVWSPGAGSRCRRGWVSWPMRPWRLRSQRMGTLEFIKGCALATGNGHSRHSFWAMEKHMKVGRCWQLRLTIEIWSLLPWYPGR